jgi:hypothetical protein
MAGVANRAQDRKYGLFHAVVAAAILAHVALVAVTFGVTLPRPADPATAPALPSAAALPVTRAALPPLAPGGRIVGPSSAEQLQQTFEDLAFDLDEIRVTVLPGDLGRIADIDRRKSIFLRTALPLVLMASEEVRQDRMRILEIQAKRVRGVALDPPERRWLAVMAAHYEVAQNDFENLLRHVDTVPASLALAQSIEESGWGTSRLAQEGRALYGQRTWSARIAGLVPAAQRDASGRLPVALCRDRRCLHRAHPAPHPWQPAGRPGRRPAGSTTRRSNRGQDRRSLKSLLRGTDRTI